MALPVSRHIDPVIGVDVHNVIVTPGSPPVPIPHPHVGFVIDPREYISSVAATLGCMAMDYASDRAVELAQENPELAASVLEKAAGVMDKVGGVVDKVTSNPLVSTALSLNAKKNSVMEGLGANIGHGGGRMIEIAGLLRTTAGTHTQHFPGLHFPLGTTFAPDDINPSRDAEAFMGSKTVLANSDPLTFAVLPALSCWMKGIDAGDHNSEHTERHYDSLPTSIILPIPMGRPVLVGGPPFFNAVKLIKALWGSFRGSELAKALADKLGLPKSCFVRCQILDAEPVNSTTGEVVVEQRDFTLPGRLPFSWERYYHGHSTAPGSLGAAWQTLADCRLEVLRHGALLGVVAHFPDRKTAFDHFPVLEGDEGEEADWQNNDRLQRRGDLLILRTRSGIRWHFRLPPDWRARLCALADSDEAMREGDWQPDKSNTLTLALQAFSDRNDNAWRAMRDAQGRLSAFTEYSGEMPVGRALRFSYDGAYPQAIAAISLWLGGEPVRTLVSYRYDAHGDMVAVEDAAEIPYTFSYEEGHRMVRHTNRNGLSFYYAWQRHDDGVMRVTHAWGDDGLFDYRFEYHVQDSTTLITDSLGQTTRLECNASGLPVSRTNGAGETFSYRYDACGHTVRETNPLGHSTEWHYDAAGNEVAHIRADRSRVATTWREDGLPLSITDPQGGVWQQTFDSRGNLVAQQTPEGVITRYRYDERGQLTAVEHAGGGVTQLAYDAYGFLCQLTDPLAHTQRYSFDVQGNLLSRTQEAGETTLYRYDLCNRVVNIRQPDGRTLDCSYDAEGNLVRYSDDNRLVTQFTYCGQGRLKTRTEPDGSTVRYHYDTEERLTGVENQRGERWQLERDAAGRLIQEVDYQGGVRRYGYDPAGHLTQATDPLGNLMQVTCDRMGRIVSQTPQAEQAGGGARFRYDALGRLTEAVNDTATVSRRYSADGHLIEEWQRQATLSSQHEYRRESGRLVSQHQRIYGNGGRELLLSQEQALYYDDAGRLTQLMPDDNTPLTFTYNARHQLSELHCSDAFSQSFSYTRRGQLSQSGMQVKGRRVAVTEYGYDENNQLIRRSDSISGTDHYRYDPLGQITAHIDPTGQLHRYTYDALGNRFQVQAHDETGRVLAHSDGSRWHMDGAGQLRLRCKDEHEQRLDWDAYGRLRALGTAQGRWGYGYDALGRRLYKQEYDASGLRLLKTTWFSWDGDRLAGEVCHDETRQPVQGEAADWLTAPETAWTAQGYLYHPGTFEPLAMQLYQAEPGAELLRRAGRLTGQEAQKARLKADTLCFYQNDPNGMPLRLWSSTGEVLWSAHYSVTGQAQVSTASYVWQPLRLQGQYFDAESGLHYNRFRYYDPRAGLFISKDPIGLLGGLNPYQFAPNILMWVDPLGLVSFLDVLNNTDVKENASSYPPLSDKNLIDLYNQATATSGHSSQRMTNLDDAYRVIFRDDRGENSHPLPGGNNQDVDHFNLEVHTKAGNIKYNLHIIPEVDENDDLVGCTLIGGKKK